MKAIPLKASPNRTLLFLKLVLTAVFWGGTFVAGRIAAREAGPFSAAFLRFLIATTLLMGFVLKSHGKIPSLGREQLLPIFLLGMTGIFGYNILFFSGLKRIAAGRASLVIASNPAFIALLASLVFRERLTLLKVVGISFSIAGAVVVITHGRIGELFGKGLGIGELYIFGCVICWVAYSLIGKVAMKHLSPLVAVTYACLAGTVCLFFPALAEGVPGQMVHYSASVWASLSYLGLFGSALGFVWYYEGIRIIGPSRAGVFINIVPVSAIVLAYFFLKESLDASLSLGGLLVLIGITLTNKAPAASANAPNSPPPALSPLPDPPASPLK